VRWLPPCEPLGDALPVSLVRRPIWRRYSPRFVANAAAHVRAGGFAAIVGEGPRITLLLPREASGKLTTFALWSLLVIDARRARIVREGVASGLGEARVKRGYEHAVLDWCDRDSLLAGPTRLMRLNCIACTACCSDNDVVVEAKDRLRWKAAETSNLEAPELVRRGRDGRLHLRLRDDGRCMHLEDDGRCSIYALRPQNCAAFPAGSEACLLAREETLGIREGSRR